MKEEVFQYSNYRNFLKESFKRAKEKNPYWSYRAWAVKLSLGDNSSLLKIINGQREAGPGITKKLIDYYKFNKTQSEYFENLVHLSKVKNDSLLTLLLMQRMKEISPKGQFNLLDEKSFALISEWWHLALRRLIQIETLKFEPCNISKKLLFKVIPKDIEKAILNLQELQLIEIDKNHFMHFKNGNITTSNDISQEALKRFHEGMLTNAREAIRTVDILEREYQGRTLTLKMEELPRAKEYLRKMMDQFFDVFHKEDKGERVYHVQTQFFPITKLETRKITEEK